MSGQFDPSIITNAANTGTTNSPLNALLGAAQIGNQLYSLKRNRADLAAGQDFQKAIDPSTGQLNIQNFNKLLATDAPASLSAIAAGQAGQTNQTTQLGNQSQEIQNGIAHLTFAANLATGYAENPPTAKQVQSDLAEGINQGVLDPETAAKMAVDPPYDAPPAVQKAYWLNHAQTGSAAIGQIGRFLPATQPIDTGSGMVEGQGNPLAPGYTAPGTQVNYGLPPEQLAKPVTAHLPDGSLFQGTLGQYLAKAGASAPQGAVVPPAGTNGPDVPLPDVPLGNGRMTPPAAQPPSPLSQGAGIVQPAGTDAIAANDTQFYTGAQDNQQAAQSTVTALRNVLAAAPGAQTGPAAETIASVSSALNEFGINLGATQAEQEQNLTKNGVQLVAALASKLGTPTDGKIMEAALGNPNANLTEGAIRTIGAEMTGTASLANATANYLQKARAEGATPGTAAFAGVRRSLNDPMLGTAFQFAYLDPAARGRVLDALGGLKSTQAQQLTDALNFAYTIEPSLPPLRAK